MPSIGLVIPEITYEMWEVLIHYPRRVVELIMQLVYVHKGHVVFMLHFYQIFVIIYRII